MTDPKTTAQITETERALLRFPGSVPGVLRRGSPVLYPVSPLVRVPGRLGLFIGCDIDSDAVLITDTGRDPATWWPAGEVFADLKDATGRAHLAWWVDARSQFGRVWYIRDLRFHMTGPDFILSTLDPNDPRLLPDGSRWVDAEALSLVARHVAGLEADHA